MRARLTPVGQREQDDGRLVHREVLDEHLGLREGTFVPLLKSNE